MKKQERTLAQDKTFYITTPIYYVNGVPHVGSATTTLLCDAIARYHRLRGEPTFFLTGTDENAQKVADAAARAGKTAQEFVDEVSQRYGETWQFLNIANNDFIRTTEPRHKEVVVEVFRRLQASGDIYAGQYEGWYSVADETFFRDSEVVNGRTIETGAIVERVMEDVYYFRLSAYSDRLLQHIEENPNFLQPETRRNEVLSLIKGGLRDRAVSRRNTGWGIPVPGDEAQVVYVWFDALINYLAVTGWPNNPQWNMLWPADVHMVGKEIYTLFHATLWPAMLLALDLPLPKVVLGHGWWLVSGEKGSKSKGNIPTPQAAVEWLVGRSGATPEVAVDALRYYLIRDISFTGDSEFSLDNLVTRYNDVLANDMGNLLNRTLNMLRQYLDSTVPTDAAARTADGPLATLAREVVQDVERAMSALDPGGALAAIARLVGAANKEIETTAPWKRHKAGDVQGVADALYAALETNRIVSILIAPFLPHTSSLIRRQLGIGEAMKSWQNELAWGGLPDGAKTQEAQPIFPRIDTKKETKPNVTDQPTPDAAPAAPIPANKLISIEDFAKVKLKIAQIKTAERIENANKLLRLTVDAGEGADRQLVAGIAENHNPADLPGRKIVIVANLQPATIRGVESNGMLLAATDEEGRAILLKPEDETIFPGAKIK